MCECLIVNAYLLVGSLNLLVCSLKLGPTNCGFLRCVEFSWVYMIGCGLASYVCVVYCVMSRDVVYIFIVNFNRIIQIIFSVR